MTDTDPPDTVPASEPAICCAARALVGLAYPSQAYLDAIAPGETPERQLEMGRESGCALLWRARNGGQAPYIDGQAFADMWRLAGGSPWAPGGRVRLPGAALLLAPGDAIVYDRGPGGPQHVDVCWLGNGQAVAGGQRDAAGNECVAIVERSLVLLGGRYVDRHTGRPIMAIIAPA